LLGELLGDLEGLFEGDTLGFFDGDLEGVFVGLFEGDTLGFFDGEDEGLFEVGLEVDKPVVVVVVATAVVVVVVVVVPADGAFVGAFVSPPMLIGLRLGDSVDCSLQVPLTPRYHPWKQIQPQLPQPQTPYSQ
jgi:hypothetical protein